MEEEYIRYEKESAVNKKQGFFVLIPTEVLEHEILTCAQKLLYGLITSYCNKNKKCFASNNRMAKQLSVGITTISQGVSTLKNEGYIDVEMIYREDSKEIKNRIITLAISFKKPLTKKQIEYKLSNPMDM